MAPRLYSGSRLLGSCVVGILAAAAAAAQEAAPQPAGGAEAQATELEEVVVTGSRIRRTEFNSVSPMLVLTREETTMAGFSSLTESLQSTTVTGGSAQINNAFGGFVTDGGPGANTIGLRGLGPSRTLVLLNGRRVAPAGSRGSVGTADLNVLPSAMIERVDVLRDGASSIYGSDAIAGVINIITRENLNETSIEAQYNGTEEGGGAQTRFSIASGLTGERYAVAGSLEYYRRQDLTLADRDWTRCNQDYTFNADGSRSDFIDPITGEFKCYPITYTGSNGVTINTIGTPRVPGVPGPGTTGSSFNRWRPNSGVTTGLVGYEGVSLFSRDTFEPRMLNESLISPVQTYTGFFEGRYDLQALGNAELYGEVLLNRRESEQFGYRQLALDYARGSLLLPSNLRTLGLSGFSDIAPDGYSVRAFIGLGNDKSSQTVDFVKGTAGLRGDLGFLEGWRYDAYVSYSKSDAEYTFQAFLIDSMIESLDVVAAPTGTPSALVRNGLTCRANLANPSAGCIPAPALSSGVIGGVLPQDWFGNNWNDITGNTTYEETVVSATIDGALFDLPAGSVGAAFGFEFRDAEIDDTPGLDSQNSNLYGFTSSAITRGSDSVWELYGELELPLLKDMLATEELTLNLSARYTEYDSYGNDTTYKAALSWMPTSWLSVRGTYGTSFRAPALFEQFQGATTGFLSNSNDPCNDFGDLDPSSARYQNCASEGLPPDWQATSSVEVVTVGGADAGLEAETSENFTAGFILQPTLRNGSLAIAIDYYEIVIDNGVTQAGASNILDLCYDDPEFRAGGSYCRLVDPRFDNNQLRVFDSYINLATQVVEGIDYNARYSRPIGPTELLVNLRLSQFLTQEYKLFQDDPWDDTNGTINNPDWAGQFDASVDWNAWTFRYALEWVGGMDSYAYIFGPGGGSSPSETGFDFEVSDYFLHHLSAQYTHDDAWAVTFGVRNLLNEDPPVISAGSYNRVGNSPLYSGYDYVGREYFLNMRYSF